MYPPAMPFRAMATHSSPKPSALCMAVTIILSSLAVLPYLSRKVKGRLVSRSGRPMLQPKKCSKIWMSHRSSSRCRSHRMKHSGYKFKNEAMWMVHSLSTAKQKQTASHNKSKFSKEKLICSQITQAKAAN